MTVAACQPAPVNASRLERFLATLQPHEKMLPEECVRAPSKINIWRGARFALDLFTRRQLGDLAFRKLDPETIDFFTCRSKVTRDEWYWNDSQRQPVFVLPCPVLRKNADGSRIVITPYGDLAKAPAHGWVRGNPFEKAPKL